jgi:3-hydroxyacyl-[acyl-carrier-protein] dehydratase
VAENNNAVWYRLDDVKRSVSGEISARAVVPESSQWFSGHFPGDPILPAIAQLGMVFDAIRQTSKHPVKISRVGRVRFKQVVRPGDGLQITASPMEKEAGSYSFQLSVQEELVCSGMMVVESPDA